jgi:electron transport complex protein RnfC
MLLLKTFKGGIHPPDNKHFTKDKAIETMPLPKKVIIPVHQHIGAPCNILVNIGDEVKEGQKICEANGFVSSPIYASIAGKVTAIEPFVHPVIAKHVNSIVIENPEGKTDSIAYQNNEWTTLSSETIINLIKEAGIVGLGGAAFPTHVKLTPPKEKKIEALVVNGVECEPYLTNDYRLMLEKTNNIIEGIQIILKVLGINKAFIGIEANKKDAVKIFKDKIESLGLQDKIETVMLKVKYPQGAEKQLIKAILKKEVPSGGLPFDVGVIVQNIGTVYAIQQAVCSGKPLIERVITVSGDGIKDPKNVLVRLGTPFKDIVEYCGGLTGEIKKILMGGPMMGIAQYTLDVPVIKGTSGILLLKSISDIEEAACIKCGRCVSVCPMYLSPNHIGAFAKIGDFNKCKEYGVLDCIECGSCAYVCSAGIPLVHYFKYAKMRLATNKK